MKYWESETPEGALDELYVLTQREQAGEGLSPEEEERYSELVGTLRANGVEIPFGIEI